MSRSGVPVFRCLIDTPELPERLRTFRKRQIGTGTEQRNAPSGLVRIRPDRTLTPNRKGYTMNLPDTPNYHVLRVAELTPEQQSFVPPLVDRQALRLGDTARLLVRLADGSRIAPWVTITAQVGAGLFIGEVGSEHATEWLPRGFSVPFGPDNVIEL